MQGSRDTAPTLDSMDTPVVGHEGVEVALTPDIQTAFLEYIRFQGYNRTLAAFLAESGARPPQNPFSHGMCVGCWRVGEAAGASGGVLPGGCAGMCLTRRPLACLIARPLRRRRGHHRH